MFAYFVTKILSLVVDVVIAVDFLLSVTSFRGIIEGVGVVVVRVITIVPCCLPSSKDL